MKKITEIGFLMILMALALTACATTKIENIIRPAGPIEKIESLAIKTGIQ